MLFVLLSILFSAYLGIIFAYFHRYRIDIFQAIVFNYGTCVLTGTVMLGHFPINAATLGEPYFRWAMAMGILFISVFNLIGFSSVKVGITITQSANRLSMVIPVAFAYFLYNESISPVKILGIILALSAVIFVSAKPNPIRAKRLPLWEYLLPLILFISSGIIDTLTKYVQATFLVNEYLSNTYLISGFFTAFVIGICALLYQYATGKRHFHSRYLVSGILLGVPNYFSIYFLVKALQSGVLNSSAIIPINNIGVLFVVSLFGIFIFHEKLSRLNFLGLLLTLLAILLIFAGDKG